MTFAASYVVFVAALCLLATVSAWAVMGAVLGAGVVALAARRAW